MKLNVVVLETGSSFSVEVDFLGPVLGIKQNIEKSRGIPVAKQTLFFEGKLLQDDQTPIIPDDSSLILSISTEDTPSISTEDFLGQDLSLRTEDMQSCWPPMISNVQDYSVMVRSNNNQTEQSPVPSISTEELLGQDFSMTTEDMINMQSCWPPVTSNVQDSSVMVRSNNNQTEQFPPPSNLSGDIIYGQEWPMMVRSNNNQVLQTEQFPVMSAPNQEVMNTNGEVLSWLEPSVKENLYSQDSPVVVTSRNNESQSLSDQIEEFLLNQDFQPVTIESSRNNESQSLSDLDQIEEFLNQDFQPVTIESSRNNESQSLSDLDQIEEFLNQDFQPVTIESSRNNELSLPSYTMDELFGVQELPPVTVGSRRNRNQVAQTEKSPVASDSAIEVINITDSPVKKKMKTGPVKLTVRVKPYEETRKILMEFNAGDKVEELRKELVKMQEKGEVNLPQPFFFIHKQEPMTETESFYWNHVAHGDLIEIWPGEIISGGGPVIERVSINRA